MSVTLGGCELVAGTDYDVTYANNVNAGTATATIAGKGNYAGTKTVEFSIARKPVNVPAAATGLVYDGIERTGVPAGEGYALTGDVVRTGAGTYAATATLDENHVWTGGSAEPVDVNWSIAPKGVTVTADDKTRVYGEADPALTATVEGLLGEDTVAYSVSRAPGDNAGEYAITPTGDAEQGNYAVTYVSGKLTIAPADISAAEVGPVASQKYTGSAVTPRPVVRMGSATLGEGADYDLSYASNVEPGTATVTVTGKGNYAGGGTYEFQITPKSLASGYVVGLPKNADGTDIIYTETSGLDSFEPVPIVKDAGGKVLDPASYDVTYLNNSVAGEATVTVTGKGNYKGSPANATFTIYKFAGTAASDAENAVIWHVEDGGAMTIEPKKKDKDAELSSASSLTWSQAVADYTTEVKVDERVKGCTDASGMFGGLANVTSVDISEFDTSQVTNMSGMFAGCESLTAGGITGTLDTGSVTDMSDMFAGCTSLESIGFAQPVQQQSLFQSLGRLLLGTQANEGFDTSNVTNMSGMFRGCASLTGEGVKDRLNTGNVTNMSDMFAGCTGLTNLDLNGINTESVTDMSGMFRGCTGLKTLNVASFDTKSVTNISGMYDGCALGQFTIGEGYMNASVPEALPEPGASTGKWWATDAQAWRSNDAIRSLGTQAAGTYSNTGLLSSASVASADIEAATANPYVYDGSEHRPSVDGVTIGQGQDQIVLVAGIDYEVSYQDNVNAGTAKVVVTGTGDYGSSANRDFAIQPKSLEDGTIEVTAPANATYNGTEHKGKPTVKSTNGPEATLVEDVDYTLGYQNNVNAGTATVTVTGTGNYSGAKEATFKIGKAASTVSLADQTLAYTGKVQAYSGKVTKSGSTGDVTFAYYSDAACSKAVAASDVKSAGTYFVRGTLEADANHNGATSNVAKLTIDAKTFPDVKAGEWYADVVSRLVGLGFISGYQDGRFGPDDNITRGQVAVVLWKMAGQLEAGAGARDFPDVKDRDYYYQAVRWASSKGVVNGYGNGNFGPNDNVSREQLAVMLGNYYEKVAGKTVSGSAADFASMADADKVAGWAVPAVGWCFKKGILSGSGGRVLPQGNATRAQAAKMAVYLYDMLA